MFILKKGHQPGVYVPLRALFLVIKSFSYLQVAMTYIRAWMSSKFCQIRSGTTELAALEHLKIDDVPFSHYTPGIYAEGYIVFVFPFVSSYVRSFVCSFVRLFVLPSVTWNLRQSFALKFLKWCISQQLLIRKHSYLDHGYPGGLAFTT